jgi:hypothetical protein
MRSSFGIRLPSEVEFGFSDARIAVDYLKFYTYLRSILHNVVR